MKRWQELGVVEDSEDEELSQSWKSTSPERPHKRQKHDQILDLQGKDVESPSQQQLDFQVSEKDDEDGWIRPKVARMYGRNAKAVKETARLTTPEPELESQFALPTAPILYTPSQSCAQDSVASSPVPSPPHFHELPDVDWEHGTRGFPMAQPSSSERLLSSLLGDCRGTENDGSSPFASRVLLQTQSRIPDDEAPSPSLGRSHVRTQSPASLEALVGAGGIPVAGSTRSTVSAGAPASPPNRCRPTMTQSTASSPLSERDVSPPPNWFTSPRAGQSGGQHVTQDRSSPDYTVVEVSGVNEDHRNDDMLPLPVSTRTFRSRKPIQLQPYQLERMSYLQKCRARGMKAVIEEERLRIAQRAEKETQTSSSQSQEPASDYTTLSSPAEDARRKPRISTPLNYFAAAAEVSSDDDYVSNEPLPKRRRVMIGLDNTTVTESASKQRTAIFDLSHDEYSVPPSPPRTSSDTSPGGNVSHSHRRSTALGFKMPAGLTLAPLPTPQISSELRPDDAGHPHSSDSTPRRPRSSAFQKRRELSIISVSSEEPSDHDDEFDLEAKRIFREKKRIKGVLPASWLRIDFNAQKARRFNSPSDRQQVGNTSPQGLENQKGVARRINTKKLRDDSPSAFLNSTGDDSDSNESVQSKTANTQTLLPVYADRRTAAPSTIFDDDEMENDFVDPMLAGGPRMKQPKRKVSKQPRITEGFLKHVQSRKDFSEERTARSLSDRGRPNIVARGSQLERRRKARFPSPVHLSIADAPISPNCEGALLPTFVRLSLRRTRHVPQKARHPPTHKIIRLQTAGDTEDALSVLRAWRSGAIAPKADPRPANDNMAIITQQETHDTRHIRTPLGEVSPNNHQSVLRIPHLRAQCTRAPALQVSHLRKLRQKRLNLVAEESRPHRDPTSPSSNKAPDRGGRRVNPGLVPNKSRLRTAQLESLQTDFDHEHRSAIFEHRMQRLTEHLARRNGHVQSNEVQMNKYLEAETSPHIKVRAGQRAQAPDIEAGAEVSMRAVKIPRRARKRQAQNLNVLSSEYEQLNNVFAEDLVASRNLQSFNDAQMPVLEGLSTLATRCSVDFGTLPIDSVSTFPTNSFIGSGDLENALRMPNRRYDQKAGLIRIHLGGIEVEWSVWSEDVASDWIKIPQIAREALDVLLKTSSSDVEHDRLRRDAEYNVDYLLRSVVRYNTSCLWFADPIDRPLCVQSLERLVDSLSDVLSESTSGEHFLDKNLVCVAQYQVVIAKQASLLCDDVTVPTSLQVQVQQLLDRVVIRLPKLALAGRFDRLRMSYVAMRCAEIPSDDITVTSLIILNHTLGRKSPGVSFWHAVGAAISVEGTKTHNVADLESAWHHVFTILPALEIDARGNVKVGSRLVETQDGSAFVKTLVSRTLELYDASSQIRGYPINEYLRTILSRCYGLVNIWGWWRCEPLLNAWYDFFSRRNFALLHKEEARGSPRFLELLDASDLLEVFPDDRSFHIFLKLLLTGLRGMHKSAIYDDRKIQSIAYRLLPNHGRSFRRDSEVNQRDLDALRNHYDLLCTLYCATPPGWRIALDGVRNLIDHSVSHREACRISVRAWTNITCFQASMHESKGLMSELSDWFFDMFTTAVTQYRLAKSEAEHDYERAVKEAHHVGADMPASILELTIANNQVVIARTIVDALAGLKRAIESCSSLEIAKALVEGSRFWTILDFFDVSQNRLVTAVMEALRIISALLDLRLRLRAPTSNHHQYLSEDSQEFGDFSVLEELAHEGPPIADNADPISLCVSPIWHFMSNIFGAERPADDTLVESLVDTWVRIATMNIRESNKTWTSYVDEYSSDSWYHLRDTPQKRKFTAYFMSRVLDETDSPEDIRDHVVSYWVLSLVEREATIKFQNVLTSSLLNRCPNDPLLQNLPFNMEKRTNLYQITLAEFRQRRLSLISSVLSNMRDYFDKVTREEPHRKLELRSALSALLRQTMQTMKTHYLELQAFQDDQVADHSVQGAYVKFVQQVVSFLQQHTASICPIDHFFTDSAAFPLPATDPAYVVGKLRAYVPNLLESKSRKALATFVQSVSERALADGHQQYLVDQFSTAIEGSQERGNTSPTLRHVLFTSIFPVYVENALIDPCAWILVQPLLQVMEFVVPRMLYNLNLTEEASIESVRSIVDAMLHSISSQCENVLTNSEYLALPYVLKTIRALAVACSSSFTLVQYLERLGQGYGEPSNRLGIVRQQLEAIEASLKGLEGVGIGHASFYEQYSAPWPDARKVTEKQIHESMNTNWHNSDGRYFLRRGNTSKEIVVQVGDVTTEREDLLQALSEFQRKFEATFDSRCRRRQVAWEGTIMNDVMI